MPPPDVQRHMVIVAMQMGQVVRWLVANVDTLSPTTLFVVGAWMAQVGRYGQVINEAYDNPSAVPTRCIFTP